MYMEEKEKNIIDNNLEQEAEAGRESLLLKYLLKKASEAGDSNLSVNFTDVIEITIKRGDEIKEIIRL